VLVVATAGCGAKHTVVKTVTVVRTNPGSASTAGDQRVYGQIKSLVRRGSHYELRLDPAWFLTGITANVAQARAEGRSCRPSLCPPVANDNYVDDEGHHVLTYLAPVGARGTVLTRTGSSGGPFPATSISVNELARLVAGQSSLKLFEPLSSGVWIVVHGDTVRSFAQQYIP
jgi:hypothetical protein